MSEELINLGESIFNEIDQNDYLNSIYDNMLYNYALIKFHLTSVRQRRDYDVNAALQFADLLSNSTHTSKADDHKMWAQEIISLLLELEPENEQVKYYAGSVLTNVGNFRGRELVKSSYTERTLQEKAFATFCKQYLTIPADKSKTFFLQQKNIYDRLSSNFLSYSAPTSMGKSFIMHMFIKEQIMNKEEIEFDAFTYDHGENGMGDEIEYRYDGVIVCEECGNEIQFRISGFEYPVGAYNYDDYEIYGGDFEKSPIVGIVYSQEEFDIDYAYNEFNRVERLILEISDNPDLIYNISPREFEEVINRVLQDEGFETELTQATRDGGRDIVATKYEMGKPIVFYIECKRYGRRNSVGVSIVRSLYGVQTSDQINKSILVTTGHVTRGARRFVEKQNTMMSILDVNEIHHLIQRSAMKYR